MNQLVRRMFLQQRGLHALALALLLPMASLAQETFPSKPLRIILPVPPGAGTDVAARVLSVELQQLSGQPVTVENKPGGNNVIGAQAVLSLPADGHALFFGSNASMAANVVMFKQLGYNPLADFQAAAPIFIARWVLTVGAGSPYASIEALIQDGTRTPGKVNTGVGTSGMQMAASLLLKRVGVAANMVPYKGVPQALTDTASGQVAMTVTDIPSALPLIRGGKLKALVVMSDDRNPVLPNVPTMREKGYGTMPLYGWGAMFVKANTPVAIVNRLHDLLERSVRSAAFTRYLMESNNEPMFMSASALAEFQKEQVNAYREGMATAGILPE